MGIVAGGALTNQAAAFILLAVIGFAAALYCVIEWLERRVVNVDDPFEQLVADWMEERRG